MDAENGKGEELAMMKLVEDVPPMPLVAQRVLQMSRNMEDIAVADLVKVVSTDPGLTSKVLATCNSPFFGLRNQVRTLSQAVVLLGVTAVRNLILLHSLPVHGRSKPSFEETSMWMHSMGAALAARHLAQRSKQADPEEAFLAGLLHDVGRLILSLTMGERYLTVFRSIYNKEGASIVLEQDAFGFNHAEVGELITRRWEFPEDLAGAVGRHHDDVSALSGLTLVVRAADEVTHWMGIGSRPTEQNEEVGAGTEALGLTPEELESARERIQLSLEQEMAVFQQAS
ncbi:MAG: HDOD domain-containing protein [Candidatus Eisenbacteria bacterium]|nr:HDOD domain-containing protein [Candidatus Eisenbacteria bacterium]